jgi:peptidoglycan hydrolase-like protein with peptidoglycan-binding domain
MIRIHLRTWRQCAAAVSIGSLLLSGCSLINPHVTPDMPRPTFGPAQSIGADGKSQGAPAPKVEFAGDVGTAIDYANSWIDAYYEAVGDQSKLKNGIALVAVPASAAALYFGVTGNASRDVITGLATGVAGLIGLGTFLESDDRQRVYLAGGEAIGCIILTSRSLMVPQTDFDAIATSTNELVAATDETEQARSAANAAADALRAAKANHPALLGAANQLADADKLIADSRATATAAGAFLKRISVAGLEIVTRVRNVTMKVSEEITRTEPDLASITSITGGLSGAAGRVGNIPPAQPIAKPTGGAAGITAMSGASEAEKLLEANLQQALEKLRASSIKTAAAATKVRSLMILQESTNLPSFPAQSEADKAAGKLENCGLENLTIGIQIDPASNQVTLKPGESYSFTITGGKRPYAAVLSEGRPEGIALLRGGFDQQPFLATVTTDKDKTKAGNFALAIGDATTAPPVLINFKIDAAAGASGGTTAPGGTTPTTPKPTVALNGYEMQLSKAEVMIAQFGAGAAIGDVDGKIGGNTRVQIKDFQHANGKPETGELDEGLFVLLAKTADANWKTLSPKLACRIPDSLNSYECTQLAPDEFAAIQQKLAVPPSGKFDVENTRPAIAAFQAGKGLPVDRQLSPSLVVAIEGP